MAALVPYQTIPELFTKLFTHFDGQGRTVLRYKDKQTKEWIDITWEQLQRQVEAMAGFLHKNGVRMGDRVAILSENRPEWAVADLATQFLGAINVSLYTSLPPAQVAYILKDSESKVLVVSTSMQLKKADQIREDCPELKLVVSMTEVRNGANNVLWQEAIAEGATYWKEHEAEIRPLATAVTPEHVSALIYTSGTTGNPKGVMLTHRNLCSNAQAATDFISFHSEDHHLSFLPLCHSFERTAGYTCVLSCGARISYAESVDAVSKNLEEVHPTVLISVPRVFEKVYNAIHKSIEEGGAVKKQIFEWAVGVGKKVAESRRRGVEPGPVLRAQKAMADRLVFEKIKQKLGGNLRFAVSGGAALSRSIGEFFEAAGILVIEGYGLTETSPVLAANPLEAPRYGAVGMILPGITVGIMRVDDGKLLGQINGNSYPNNLTTGEGEIVAKGPNVMKGYWGHEDETKKMIDADGWLHSGDVGRFDNGYLMITDRIKHMIVSAGGKNIYPGPIEEIFSTVQWIDQIMVVGEGREYLTALVVPNFDALKRFAQEHNITYTNEEDLIANDKVQGLYEQEFKTYSKSAAAHEKIRGFRLLAEPFTIENGMMTPSLKLRRRQIAQRYSELIDELYA